MIDRFDHTHWKHILQCRCPVFGSFAVLSSLPSWWSDSAHGLQHPYAMYASEHVTGNHAAVIPTRNANVSNFTDFPNSYPLKPKTFRPIIFIIFSANHDISLTEFFTH